VGADAGVGPNGVGAGANVDDANAGVGLHN
jgi:hypothetical protein